MNGFFRLSRIAGLVVLLGCVGGCAMFGDAGSMRVEALGDDRVVLRGNFTTAYYSEAAGTGTSFVLSDVPLEDVRAGTVRNGQIMHVQLLWLPQGGRTPMEPTATNASIRYVVIANGEVGVYGGAGFARPSGSLDSKRVRLTLRDASLQLEQATPGFNDLLSPAQITGTFTATLDEKRTVQLQRAVSQLVTNALGQTRIVRRQCGAEAASM
jgi:hypothetical protein